MHLYDKLLSNEQFLNTVKKIEKIKFITDGKWDWEHGLSHYKRVAEYVKIILLQLGADERTIDLGMTAALLHDIGLSKGNKVDHAIESSKIFINFIDKNDITQDEEKLYNKWIDIYKIKIKSQYGNIYNDSKIQKLAQENARYLVTVFMPTQMIYSTSLRQINYIASWMQDYIKTADMNNDFERKLSSSMQELLECLADVNVLEEGLLKNEKYRSLSIFGKDLDKKEEHFGNVYSCTYKGSFAELAQAHRHRTLDYQMEMLDEKEYFVPPIIADDQMLVDEWLGDMQIVKGVNPQGELVKINEVGKYEDFILKCKERLCTSAQLEIMLQTRETLLKYKKALEESGNPLAKDIEKYSHGARCTFPDFNCPSDCKFSEGKILVRQI